MCSFVLEYNNHFSASEREGSLMILLLCLKSELAQSGTFLWLSVSFWWFTHACDTLYRAWTTDFAVNACSILNTLETKERAPMNQSPFSNQFSFIQSIQLFDVVLSRDCISCKCKSWASVWELLMMSYSQAKANDFRPTKIEKVWVQTKTLQLSCPVWLCCNSMMMQ